MKKLLLSMLLVMATVLSASATKLVMSASQTADQTVGQAIVSGITIDGYTFDVQKNTSSTAPTYNSNGKDVRIYAKGSINIKSETPITKVIFVISNNGRKRLTDVTASTGTVDPISVCQKNDPNPVYVTWTGSATDVTFTVGDKAVYGTDGADQPGQLCFSELYINQDVEEEVVDPSDFETVESIAAWLAKADTKNPVVISNPVTAIYQNGVNLYVKDDTGFLLIYGATGQTYNNGDVIPGGIAGVYAPFRGLPEMGSLVAETFKAGTAGAPVAPELLDNISTFPSRDYSKYVEIQHVTVAETGTNRTYTISDETGSMVMYQTFTDITINPGTDVTVRGFVGTNNGTAQLSVVYLSNSEGEDQPADGVENIAEWLAKADTENVVAIKNPVSVAYQNGNRLYVKDSSGWLLIYGNIGKTYTNGQMIPGGFAGKFQEYKGLPEMVSPDASTFADGIAGTAVEPTFVMIEDLASEPISSYIELEAVTLTGVEAKNGTITDEDGNSIAAYNQFNLESFADGEDLTIRGFVAVNNDNRQIIPTEILSATEASQCAEPVFAPGAGSVPEGTAVTITTSTAGAEIRFTVDGSEPTATSQLYSTPIVLTAAVTIKAVAMKAGLNNSAVVSATYEMLPAITNRVDAYFVAPTYTVDGVPTVVKLTNNDDSESGASSAEETSLCGKTFTSAICDMVIEKGNNNSFSFAAGSVVRWYQGATMTITPKDGETLRRVEFHMVKDYANSFNATTGVVNVDGLIGTWEGLTTEPVTFTTTGQIRFNYFVVTSSSSGIEGVAADLDANTPVVYYNLQGARVENPAAGLYIRVQGRNASKVLVK